MIFLWTYTNWGGAQIYLFAIMKLAREEWDVVVALPRNSKPDLLAFLDQLNIRYEFLNNHFDPQPEATLLGKLKRQFARIRAEIATLNYLRKFDLSESVLHIETSPWQSWLLLLVLSLRQANVFSTLHNFRLDTPSWRVPIWKVRLRIVSRLPRFHIFASNRDCKESLKEWVTLQFWKDIRITYTSVDPEQIATARAVEFDKQAVRDRVGVGPEDFVVLSVGQFIDRKGRWTLLDAAKEVCDAESDVVFVWVMPEKPSEKDRERIESYGIGNRFIPVLSSSIGMDRQSILKFFRIGDTFALPSFIEGLPIALLEAMALELPSISTNVYAIPEAIIHEETGLLIEAGDGAALAESILRMRRDAQLRERLGKSGSSFVLDHFDERVAASICIESYRRCFDGM